MLWFFLSLLTAFAAASEGAVIKWRFADLRAPELVATPLLFSLPFFLAMTGIVERPETPDPAFWTTVALLAPINAVGFICHTWALKLSPLSLTLPFLAFTPLLVVLTGSLILGELPGPWGGVGVAAIVIGSYVINLDSVGREGLWGPIKAIGRERGSLLMLCAAAIWGLAAVLGKKLVLQSSPMYAAAWFFSLHNSALLLALVCTGRIRFRVLAARYKPLALLGGLYLLEIVCHYSALALIEAVYMVAVKRLLGVFAVGYGWFFFKERNIGYRFAGAAVMTAGAVVIAMWG